MLEGHGDVDGGVGPEEEVEDLHDPRHGRGGYPLMMAGEMGRARTCLPVQSGYGLRIAGAGMQMDSVASERVAAAWRGGRGVK